MFKSNSLKSKTSKIAVMVATMILGSVQSGMAQSAVTQTTTTQAAGMKPAAAAGVTAKPIKRFTGAQNYMYSTVIMKDAVELRDLPHYPGQNKFTGGLQYPNLKTGQCYLMRYLAKESSREVMSSYRNALIQAGWQINEKQTNNFQMTASKSNGLYCTFCVLPSYEAGYKTSFEIKYLFMGGLQTH